MVSMPGRVVAGRVVQQAAPSVRFAPCSAEEVEKATAVSFIVSAAGFTTNPTILRRDGVACNIASMRRLTREVRWAALWRCPEAGSGCCIPVASAHAQALRKDGLAAAGLLSAQLGRFGGRTQKPISSPPPPPSANF